MKTIVNKTRGPLRVPLPRGKKLHLGPGKSGQVAHQDVDHKPLQQLVKDGKLEIQGDGAAPVAGREQGKGSHETTHGHLPRTKAKATGDR